MGGKWKNLFQMSLDIERNLSAPVADRPISGMAELRFKIALHRAFAWRENTLSIICLKSWSRVLLPWLGRGSISDTIALSRLADWPDLGHRTTSSTQGLGQPQPM